VTLEEYDGLQRVGFHGDIGVLPEVHLDQLRDPLKGVLCLVVDCHMEVGFHGHFFLLPSVFFAKEPCIHRALLQKSPAYTEVLHRACNTINEVLQALCRALLQKILMEEEKIH